MSAPSLTRSGRFLIARSLADEVCNQVNVDGMRMAANQSNINTEEIYKRNWSRIKHQSSQFANLATKIISWLVLAKSCNHEPAKEVIYTLLNEPNLRIVSLKSF